MLDNILITDLGVIELRYWWQSLLYFLACVCLWMLLALEYASRDLHASFVFVMNLALCSVIAGMKLCRGANLSIILGLEVLYLHATIPPAMGVVYLYPLVPTARMSLFMISTWLAGFGSFFGHPLYVSYIGLCLSTLQFLVYDCILLNTVSEGQTPTTCSARHGLSLITTRLLVATVSKLLMCSDAEASAGSSRIEWAMGYEGFWGKILFASCFCEQTVIRATRFLDQRLLIAIIAGPYVVYTFLECSCNLMMTGDSDKNTAIPPTRVLMLVFSSLALGSLEARIVISRIKGLIELLTDTLPRTVAVALLRRKLEENDTSKERKSFLDPGRQAMGSSMYSTSRVNPEMHDDSLELQQSGQPATIVFSQVHESVTVLFADIVGFTAMSSEVDPATLMGMLNHLFCGFDDATRETKVYKVETIGDCYMAVTGLIKEDPFHADTMIRFACSMLEHAKRVPSNQEKTQHVQIRIGVHSGSVMSGIVGHIRRRYCLFGNTVNTASRHESTGLPGRIHISKATFDLLCEQSPADVNRTHEAWECRKCVAMKGLGDKVSYLLRNGSEPNM